MINMRRRFSWQNPKDRAVERAKIAKNY